MGNNATMINSINLCQVVANSLKLTLKNFSLK